MLNTLWSIKWEPAPPWLVTFILPFDAGKLEGGASNEREGTLNNTGHPPQEQRPT